MKVTSLRYLDAKFHHPSLGASPPNRGKSICLPPELSLLLKRQSVNKFRHRYSMLWRLAIPAVAGLLVIVAENRRQRAAKNESGNTDRRRVTADVALRDSAEVYYGDD